MYSRNIAVVGAGTAGLACAISLAQRGHRVDVFEKHPAIAPVGAGILMQPKGVAALITLGCGKDFLAISSPIHRLQLHNHRDQRLVDILYEEPSCAFGVSRGKLTELLQARLHELGAELQLGTQATGIVDIRTEPGVMLETVASVGGMPRNWMFDAVVLACGSNSSLATRSGFGAAPDPYPWGALNGLIEVEAWPHVLELRQRVAGARRMMGLLPSGRENGKLKLSFYWSLHASAYKAWLERDWADFVRDAQRLWPEAASVLAQLRREDLSFARYRHATPATYANGRVALVGDAAHAMSPQLGLGSTLALEDALALTEYLTCVPDIAQGLAAYSEERLPSARGKQRISKALTPLFQSHLPAWIRDPWFLLGRHIPGVNRLMAYSLGL
ncbi:FAD-dependent oxidoreductase [Burkholderia ubonensis]|uniref:FAD-dependent oxidoreductase n=1 Tax=Burkholderia ubonensis TaxID=101571 RepID=UPI0007C6884E|nr:NAD(P)/FAD-dependent oxidoreductase [Burkholderia ubonensis]